jgi:hypothetical protein
LVPHLDSNVGSLSGLVGLLEDLDVAWHVTEVLGDGTFWASNSDLSGFNGDLHYSNSLEEHLKTYHLLGPEQNLL